MALFKQAQCLILALCSKMDVLWGNFHREGDAARSHGWGDQGE
jgi:hypothetical protein